MSNPDTPVAPPQELVRSPLSDGEWHRLHPLTPFLRGGFALVVVAGIVITNFRDRLLQIFVPGMYDENYPGDPVDYVLEHDLVLVALLAVVGLVLLLIGLFYVSWRFHTFRITGDDVEVRSGVLFRTHRRAPLDRVQGVNLTRPMIARLFGAAKLEVVGAGADGNVKLEYLSTGNAEAVRADILRLASGSQLGAAAASERAAGSRVAAAASVVSEGITGIIEGAEEPVAEPESVVHIPVGRLIGSQLLSGTAIALVISIVVIVVGSIAGSPWLLFGFVPAILGFGGYWVRTITRSLRYSIAPTPSGVRITFGLFTTVTEIVPPGRVHAVQIGQSPLWRKFGWWSITVNRLSGRSASDASVDPFAVVLPVGLRDDVERVVRLLLPDLPEAEAAQLFPHGLTGPAADDPYTNTPRRARGLRPLSWRRNGFLVADSALFVRRGAWWRKLGVFPFARLQSIAVTQGPVDRALRLANLQPHTIAGQVSGHIGILDRDAVLAAFDDVERRVISASAADRTHRWAGASEASVAPEGAQDAAPGDAAPADAVPSETAEPLSAEHQEPASPETTESIRAAATDEAEPHDQAPAPGLADEPTPLTRAEARAAREAEARE